MNLNDQKQKPFNIQLLSILLENEVDLFQESSNERNSLHKIEIEMNDEGYSILGEMEIFTNHIRGIVKSVVESKRKINHEELLEKLNEKNLFQDSKFLNWFEQNGKNFNKICDHIVLVDYMRLLLFEYLIAN